MRFATRVFRAGTASPLRMAATAAAITPGMHLLLSTVVERRRPSWSTEYPAVLIGDPLLAASVGIAARVVGTEAVLRSAPMRRPLAPMIAGAAMAFGVWQMHDEVRRGVYSKQQIYSPSKLWHQLVVYSALSPLVSGAVLTAATAAAEPAASRRTKAAAMLATAGMIGWGALVVEAIRHPRPAHSAFDWGSLLPRRKTSGARNIPGPVCRGADPR